MSETATKPRSLRVHFQDRELGTISSVPGSTDLVCSGAGAAGLRHRVDWYRHNSGASGEALLNLLHDRLQGYTWSEWVEDEPDLDGFELLEHHLQEKSLAADDYTSKGKRKTPPGFFEDKDKNGRRICYQDGRRCPCPKKEEGNKPAQPSKPAKPTKPEKRSVGEIVQSVREAKEKGLTHGDLHELAGDMAKLTVKEISQIKSELGVKASGAKQALVQKILEKATAPAPAKPEKPAKAQKEAKEKPAKEKPVKPEPKREEKPEPTLEKPAEPEVPQLPPAEHIPDDLPIGDRVKLYQQQRGAAMASAMAELHVQQEEALKRWKEYGRQTTEMQGRYYGVNFGSTYLYDNDTGKKLGKRESDKIRAQYEELDVKRKQAQDEYFDGTRAKSHALLQKMLGNKDNIPLEITLDPRSPTSLRGEAQAGVEFVRSLVGTGFTGGLQERGHNARLELIPTDSYERPNCGYDRINVTPSSNARVVVHELGHWMDNHLAGTLPASLAFLKHRVGNEEMQPLKKVLGDDYEDHEYGRKDDFDKAFGTGGWYVGKDYGAMATEIISKGLEKLYENAPHFAAADPEYFSFMCGICDGSLRHQEGSS